MNGVNLLKSTGVIKKMDDLGRIVIPKEMRRILNIHDGEILELYVNDDNLILKKHSSFEGNVNKIKRLIDLYDSLDICKIVVVDKEGVIVSNLDVVGYKNSEYIKDAIFNREEVIDNGNAFKVGDINLGKYLFFCPLFTELDAVGGIVMVFNDDINEEKKKFGRLLARLIVSYMGNNYC